MKIEEAIEAYLRELTLRNYSVLTIKNRRSHLDRFSTYLEAAGVEKVEQLRSDHFELYRSELFYWPTRFKHARGVGSYNQVLRSLNAWIEFLREEGEIRGVRTVEYGRMPDTLPRRILTVIEARKIIEEPDLTSRFGIRDRAILEILYATGIRCQELVNLKVADIDFEQGLLRITQGKGRKDRVVPLGSYAMRYLQSYVKGLRPQLVRSDLADTGSLFISRENNQISPDLVRHVVEKYAKLAGIKKRVTPHLWRHTCATHLLKNRANLRHVQELLGHRSLATTERYLRVTITELKAAHKRFHPRSRGE